MKALILFAILYGCSTVPTKYVESTDNKKEGFSDKTIDENLRMASFLGNSATKKDKAQLYAKFRAIEICSETGTKLAHILFVKDKSFDKEVTQATADYPTYYYGVSPYYGRFGAYGGGVGMYGYGPTSVRYDNETYTYPFYEVYFECVNKPVDVRMSFHKLSSSEVKNIVKDVMGAVQIEEILPDSPNKNSFEVGDIIVSVNGTRVENLMELYKASRKTKSMDFRVDFFRNGTRMSAKAKFLDVTEMVTQSQEEIVKEVCKNSELKDSRPLCK